MNADLAEYLVICDLISKGWVVCTPSSRDTPYDFIVDIHGKFVKIQVKKMGGSKGLSLTRRLERGNQKVTENGKIRNTIDYAERGIEWLVGVNTDTKEVFYYSIENYSKIPAKVFSVSKWRPDEFPVNTSVRRNTEGTPKLGDVAEQVDAGDLKSPDFGRVGSTPSIPTTLSKVKI